MKVAGPRIRNYASESSVLLTPLGIGIRLGSETSDELEREREVQTRV